MNYRLTSGRGTVWMVLFWLSISGCQFRSPEKSCGRILKIGTVHRAASKNILYDKALSLFSMISHPPLLKLKPDGQISCLLADDFGFSSDYRSWTFKLKKNIFWSDGIPLTSADVRFTLLFKSRHHPSRRWLREAIREIQTPDLDEIRIAFNQPRTRFDVEMTSIRIFPCHVWKDMPDPLAVESGISFTGCGPFVINDVEPFSGTIRFVRNRFWQGTEPWLEEYEVHMYHNPDVMALALERGDVDCCYKYADTFPHIYVSRLNAQGKFRLLKFQQSGLIFLGFNLKKRPLNHPDFRMAIRSALNYPEMLKLTVGEYGEIPSEGIIPPHFPYYLPSKLLRQDISQSKRLLDRLGYRYKDQHGKREYRAGETLSLNLVTTPLYIRLAELIRDYLEAIGIRIHIRILDPATWIAAKDKYDYDLTISRTTPWGMMMHAGWASGYFDFRRSGEGVLHTIDDPFYTRLCDSIIATKEPSLMISYARRLQNYYAEQVPAVALIWKVDLIPVKSNITGWDYDPLFGIYTLDSLLNIKFIDAEH